ncbi:AraC family transcriptional regulator [Streptomyces sp. NPDC000594]|uniref:AraC family transcriptional regulator n=1 Tax=Streptomyces sp. NPDC000594 TaxID=3154261 RepID=UPI0033181E21
MDPYDELLRGIRTDGAGLNRRELSPPWRLPLPGDADLTLVAPLHGEGWFTPGDGGESRPLRAGDALVVLGPGTAVRADRPPVAVLTDRPPAAGSPSAAPATLVIGTYRVGTEVARRLLAVLPPVLVMTGRTGGDDNCSPVLGFLDSQAGGFPPAQQIVQDRMLDWLLVCTLREWLDRPGSPPPGPLGALADDIVGPALRALHAAPERPWTLAALAAEAGASRTTLAERFARLVGRPPLTYLTDWRMALAADLLSGSTTTIATVARRVGYADAFGFSSAFKRVHGTSPSAYRAGAAVH